MRKHPITQKLFNVLLSLGFEDSYILDIEQNGDVIKANIQLASHCELEDLQSILQNLKQEVNALDIKIGIQNGKQIEILFGMKDLSEVPFNSKYIYPNTLQIELPSSFGSCILDFEDGASCHLLNGGTTRMGKTSLLLYLCCVLYLQNKQIHFYICSSKKQDFYPFFDNTSFDFAENEEELLLMLVSLNDEMNIRKEHFKMKELQKCTDSKSVKKRQPTFYHLFKPIFLVIDEYADYSHNREIQKLVENLVRKAGYINIHVIISTQRADARTTLPPQIKCCLSARICFTTTDKNNSIVILDEEGAENLGFIEGRAIFLDGQNNIVQVPFLDDENCDEIMSPFRMDSVQSTERTNGEDVNHEPSTNKNQEGRTNIELSNKIQNLFTQSISNPIFQGKQQPRECDQPSDEAHVSGWFRLASEERER